MSSDGFIAVARGCKVSGKDVFNNELGQPVYMLTVIGWGFTRKFITDNKSDFDSWPAAGTEVDVQANLEQTKDNTFKLVEPKFIPAKGKSGAA